MEAIHYFTVLFLVVLTAVQNVNSCNKMKKFGSWTRWTKCSSPCGTGTQSRRRPCEKMTDKNRNAKQCKGESRETRACYTWTFYSCEDYCFTFPNATGAHVILKNPGGLNDLKAFTFSVDVIMRPEVANARACSECRWNKPCSGCGPPSSALVSYSSLGPRGGVNDLLLLNIETRLVLNRLLVLKHPSSSAQNEWNNYFGGRRRYFVTWDGESGKSLVYRTGPSGSLFAVNPRFDTQTLNGKQIDEYENLVKGKLEGGDVFMLGQHRVEPGQSFSADEQFVGNLCNFQMWDRVLNGHEMWDFWEAGAVEPPKVFDNPPTYGYELNDGARMERVKPWKPWKP